jgi:hypothetical protein
MKARVKELESQITILNRRFNAMSEIQNINRARMDRAGLPPYQTALAWNTGDWTSLETVEIGDTVGGVKIHTREQRELLRSTGAALKKIEIIYNRYGYE